MRDSPNIDPTLTMVLTIRGARPKQIRNGVHVFEYDQLHTRWIWNENRKDSLVEPDKLIERLGRRMVQDLRYIWPVLRIDITKISL
jgi:hypothetical protein